MATEPTDAAIVRCTIAVHAVDCDEVYCTELNNTGRYAEWGYAAAYALANPLASNVEVRRAARAWRRDQIRGRQP